MKNVFYSVVALVTMCLFASRLSSSNTNSNMDLLSENIEAFTSCPESSTNKYCQIWKISYGITFGWPWVECTGGDSWRCESGKCPHDK